MVFGESHIYAKISDACTVYSPFICLVSRMYSSSATPAISALANGISYSNMGIASIIMFAVLLVNLKKIKI